MLPEEIFFKLGKLPYMRLEHGRIFHDFITTNRLQNGLELGFFHGVSTAYLAGAIQDIGSGALTTIDLTAARDHTPNIHWVLETTGLSHIVQIFYEPRCYTWRLMKLLEEGRSESYDFCYIDGGHGWYDTGFAFCLVERLLKPGGWVVFDDLHYTYNTSSSREKTWVTCLPEEERIVPQVKRVFELLVETSPHFGSFRRLGRFGFARKLHSVWSLKKRASNQEEIVISRALERARFDHKYRNELLHMPAIALSSFTGEPSDRFRHLCFEESNHYAPIPSKFDSSGTITVYIEKIDAAVLSTPLPPAFKKINRE